MRRVAVSSSAWLGLVWAWGFQCGGADMRHYRLLSKTEVNVLFKDDTPRGQQPIHNVPLNVICPQVGRVVKEGCDRRSSWISGGDTENVHIRYVAVEVIDDCQEPRVRRPLRVNPAVILEEENGRSPRAAVAYEKLHTCAIRLLCSSEGFDKFVGSAEAALVGGRGMQGREQDYCDGERRAHRPNM
jgi:hypothetical protein